MAAKRRFVKGHTRSYRMSGPLYPVDTRPRCTDGQLPAFRGVDDDFKPCMGALVIKTQTAYGVWQGSDKGWLAIPAHRWEDWVYQARRLRTGAREIFDRLFFLDGPYANTEFQTQLSQQIIELALHNESIGRLLEQTPLHA